jgi:hypothetical protein
MTTMTKRSVYSLLNATADLELAAPDGTTLTLEDGTPVKIKVRGMSSPDLKRRALESAALLQAASKKADLPSEWASAILAAEACAQSVAASAIVGWDSRFDEVLGGTYTQEYAEKLVSATGMNWLVSQINAFVRTPDNFFA